MRSEAWFLYETGTGPEGFVREEFELGDPTEGEVVAAPLYGAWEGNMGHALERRPIDLCQHRGEPRVIVGNAGVVRVVERGPGVRDLQPGDVAMVFGASEPDRYGYPTKIFGFDAPGTMGCLATRIRIPERNLLKLPERTKHSLPQWAAFSVRYITGWSNWSLAYRTYRLMVTEAQDAEPCVWGWGGGTALASVDLARRAGCRAVMIAGSAERLETIRAAGVEALDRRPFGELQYDEERFGADADYRRRYTRAEAAFLACVMDKTRGRGVQLFFDNIGGPLIRPTLRALSREGVVATCGWKEGMRVSYLRSVACIGRQQHVNTHYASFAEGQPAMDYAEANGWVPPVRGRIYEFGEIPELARAFAEGRTDMFPVYRVNPS